MCQLCNIVEPGCWTRICREHFKKLMAKLASLASFLSKMFIFHLKEFALSKLSMVNACSVCKVCSRFALDLHTVCIFTTQGMRENKTLGVEQTLCKPCANHVQTCANHVQTENKMVCSMQTEQTMSKHGTNPKIAHT